MRAEKCTHPLVFVTDLDRPLNRDTLNYHLRKGAMAADVEAKSGYSIRRGTATRVAEAGLDVFAMSEMFGWADIKMAQEYVQQTSTAHARMLAALRESPGLSVVDGGGVGRDVGRTPITSRPQTLRNGRGKM